MKKLWKRNHVNNKNKKKWQSWIEKKESNTWEIIVIKEKICWIVQLIMLKKTENVCISK